MPITAASDSNPTVWATALFFSNLFGIEYTILNQMEKYSSPRTNKIMT